MQGGCLRIGIAPLRRGAVCGSESPPYAGGLSAKQTGGSVRRPEHSTASPNALLKLPARQARQFTDVPQRAAADHAVQRYRHSRRRAVDAALHDRVAAAPPNLPETVPRENRADLAPRQDAQPGQRPPQCASRKTHPCSGAPLPPPTPLPGSPLRPPPDWRAPQSPSPLAGHAQLGAERHVPIILTPNDRRQLLAHRLTPKRARSIAAFRIAPSGLSPHPGGRLRGGGAATRAGNPPVIPAYAGMTDAPHPFLQLVATTAPSP